MAGASCRLLFRYDRQKAYIRAANPSWSSCLPILSSIRLCNCTAERRTRSNHTHYASDKHLVSSLSRKTRSLTTGTCAARNTAAAVGFNLRPIDLLVGHFPVYTELESVFVDPDAGGREHGEMAGDWFLVDLDVDDALRVQDVQLFVVDGLSLVIVTPGPGAAAAAAAAAAVRVRSSPALPLERAQRASKSVAELVPQGAVDDEVGGRVGDLEDEGEPARDVRHRAAVGPAVVRAVEHLGGQVAHGEHHHDDDDDARHAVLVARRRRRRRGRRRVAATAARGPHGRATTPLGAVDAQQQQTEYGEHEERQNERHHRVQDVRVDDAKAPLTPQLRKIHSENSSSAVRPVPRSTCS